MAFCNNCGNELEKGAIFCSNCGKKIESVKENEHINVFEGNIHQCPNCQKTVNSFSSKCQFCGFEIRNTKVSPAIREFQDKLEALEAQRSTYQYNHISRQSTDTTDIITKQKIQLISSYTIPNNKEELLEFMILASTYFDDEYYLSHLDVEDISDAWLRKMKQCYQKAKLIFDNDNTVNQIIEIYNETVAKIESLPAKPVVEIIPEKKKWTKNKTIGACLTAFGVLLLPLNFFPINLVSLGSLVGGLIMIFKKNSQK